jgi:hypothetical protein
MTCGVWSIEKVQPTGISRHWGAELWVRHGRIVIDCWKTVLWGDGTTHVPNPIWHCRKQRIWKSLNQFCGASMMTRRTAACTRIPLCVHDQNLSTTEVGSDKSHGISRTVSYLWFDNWIRFLAFSLWPIASNRIWSLTKLDPFWSNLLRNCLNLENRWSQMTPKILMLHRSLTALELGDPHWAERQTVKERQ